MRTRSSMRAPVPKDRCSTARTSSGTGRPRVLPSSKRSLPRRGFRRAGRWMSRPTSTRRPGTEMTDLDTSVELGGLALSNPVLAASGTFGAGREASTFVDLSKIGGIIVKSMTLVPWRGKPTPRMCETPSGMLNAIGIQNKGVDYFLQEDLPWLLKHDVTVVASIAGNTVEEFVKVADKLRTGGRGIAA